MGESSFTTTAVSQHLLSNLALVKQFVNIEYHVEGVEGAPGKVVVRGIGRGTP